MFLKRTSHAMGQMSVSGPFLVLCSPNDARFEQSAIRAFIVSIKMTQLGHFMMANHVIAGHKLVFSGTYGSDGLTCNVPREIYNHAVPVPAYLIDAWRKGGGWNGAGNEATAMRDWANANVKALSGIGRRVLAARRKAAK